MPFTENAGGISCRLEDFGDGRESWIESSRSRGDRPVDFVPSRIAARQQGSSGCRADRLGNIELVETAASFRQFFHIGSGILGWPKGAEISPSRIIQEYDYDVWLVSQKGFLRELDLR